MHPHLDCQREDTGDTKSGVLHSPSCNSGVIQRTRDTENWIADRGRVSINDALAKSSHHTEDLLIRKILDARDEFVPYWGSAHLESVLDGKGETNKGLALSGAIWIFVDKPENPLSNIFSMHRTREIAPKIKNFQDL